MKKKTVLALCYIKKKYTKALKVLNCLKHPFLNVPGVLQTTPLKNQARNQARDQAAVQATGSAVGGVQPR